MESARAKYTLALGRMRHGPPELALLSLHGSIEDALRGHAMRQRIPAAAEPFPQLVEALTADMRAPLAEAEAEGIRRMHRLRARVAHGEQIAVAAGTIDAYRRLAARLLPRYGVLVVGPEEDAGPDELSEADVAPIPPRRQRVDVAPIPPRHEPSGGRTTARIPRAPHERSAYPDDELARYATRPRRGGAEPAQGRDRRRTDALAARWQRAQSWVLPLLIIASIFLIGAAILISMQQIRAARALPTPVPSALAPAIATPPPQASADAVESVNGVAPAATAPTATAAATPTPAAVPGALAVGRGARVIASIQGLNLRERPGIDPTIPILLGLQPGTDALVVGGPVEADGMTWWKVQSANIEGWCAGEYLEPR
ncbi:SH3 domain-containing protein [Oscillochloris sp. ZM17-4]|nr:SH3 domain-containing protein [Oscillochloris sp. ZM17-4]MBX0329359.1 SH3 domain-containing protein [Oscillochloris sp. ZM17-4]